MISRLVCRTAFALFTACLFAAPVSAQGSIPAYRSLVGFNPLGIPFDIVSVEFETLVQQGMTFGLSGNYVAWDDDDEYDGGGQRWTSFDVKGRYYPGEIVLRGFSVGLSLGVTKYSERVFDRCIPTPSNPSPCSSGPPPSRRESLSTPTIGVLVDYNFLIGAQRRFLVGTGVGAKRLLKRDSDVAGFDPPRAYPFARFAIGLAF